MKDPADKHRLLVDEEAAKIVRYIFELAAGGQGYKAISRRLREAKIPNPNAYNNIVDPTFYKSNYWRQEHDWHPSSIKTILTNMTYLGHVVNGKRKVKSFKCKEIVRVDQSDWIVVNDQHEAIIDQRTWDLAQENLKRRKRCDNQGAIQMFAGLLKCADCGYSMAYRNNPKPSYKCSLNNVKGKGYCSSHYIQYDDLYEIVLADIQRKAFVAKVFQGYFVSRLASETSGAIEENIRKTQREIKSLSARAVELEQIIGKLYEDHALGRLTIDRYDTFMTKYESEKAQVQRDLINARQSIAEQEAQRNSAEKFTEVILSYAELNSLNAGILNELIDRIEIGPKETVDGVKTQKVRIVYKYVGYIQEDCFPSIRFDPNQLEKIAQEMTTVNN